MPALQKTAVPCSHELSRTKGLAYDTWQFVRMCPHAGGSHKRQSSHQIPRHDQRQRQLCHLVSVTIAAWVGVHWARDGFGSIALSLCRIQLYHIPLLTVILCIDCSKTGCQLSQMLSTGHEPAASETHAACKAYQTLQAAACRRKASSC